MGKGRRERVLPLWKETAAALRAWLTILKIRRYSLIALARITAVAAPRNESLGAKRRVRRSSMV
jgi:integrase